MTHLVCQTCQCESWSWSMFDPDPVALDFRQAHEHRGHTVVVKPIRSRRTT